MRPRNAVLAGRGVTIPRARKTGTTIVGVVFDGGVVLGADTRATEGDTVADKNCEKIHYIAVRIAAIFPDAPVALLSPPQAPGAPWRICSRRSAILTCSAKCLQDNIWCCGAGTSADTESTTALISSQLELHRMATGKQPRVVTACTMLKRMLFRYQGNVSAALVLGGVDCNGPSLYTVYPHGSTDSLPYVTMGSGSLAAMAVFEAQYKSKMNLEEAKALVHAGIMSGINNDLGSGGSVDLMVITKEGNTPLRNYARPNQRKSKRDYSFPVGTTTVLSQSFTPLSSLVTVEKTTVEPTGAKQMEID